jgi:hypothetical protein
MNGNFNGPTNNANISQAFSGVINLIVLVQYFIRLKM